MEFLVILRTLGRQRILVATGAVVAAIFPWSARLGVTTVPELITAALTVLAMASAPAFDVNKLDEQYAALTSPDNLDEPLLNRATQTPREPGSTVKPVM